MSIDFESNSVCYILEKWLGKETANDGMVGVSVIFIDINQISAEYVANMVLHLYVCLALRCEYRQFYYNGSIDIDPN